MSIIILKLYLSMISVLVIVIWHGSCELPSNVIIQGINFIIWKSIVDICNKYLVCFFSVLFDTYSQRNNYILSYSFTHQHEDRTIKFMWMNHDPSTWTLFALKVTFYGANFDFFYIPGEIIHSQYKCDKGWQQFSIYWNDICHWYFFMKE